MKHIAYPIPRRLRGLRSISQVSLRPPPRPFGPHQLWLGSEDSFGLIEAFGAIRKVTGGVDRRDDVHVTLVNHDRLSRDCWSLMLTLSAHLLAQVQPGWRGGDLRLAHTSRSQALKPFLDRMHDLDANREPVLLMPCLLDQEHPHPMPELGIEKPKIWWRPESLLEEEECVPVQELRSV